MGTQDTVQTLTILGLLANGFVLLFQLLIAILYFPTIFITILWFFLGFILPIMVWTEIPKGKRGAAGGILIVSGIVSLLFIFFIGGILLIIAGALVAGWDPYQIPPSPSSQTRFHTLGPHHEYDGNSIWIRQPQVAGSSMAQTKKCVNCGAELNRIDQYCHECGTDVSWY
ncbi:MAG: zinc ribbon domain-containing protein [Promethearchaeota archaeon]